MEQAKTKVLILEFALSLDAHIQPITSPGSIFTESQGSSRAWGRGATGRARGPGMRRPYQPPPFKPDDAVSLLCTCPCCRLRVRDTVYVHPCSTVGPCPFFSTAAPEWQGHVAHLCIGGSQGMGLRNELIYK